MATITVYSRSGCHLCEAAEEVAHRVAGRIHRVEVVDVDADPALTDRYTVRVPVVAVDGVEIAQYQLDAGVLRAALPR